MSMLHQWATGTNKQTTEGTYDNAIPNTEPTGTAYEKEKASQYATTKRQNKGGADTNDATNWNPWNLLKMWKYRKILKLEGKFNDTNMSA